MSKDHKALRFFFWFTYAAILSPSIPHIAYFFHAFEPNADGLEWIFWWVVCYAIAVSVDVTIIWLTYVMAVAKREQTATKGYYRGVWAFIIFLTLISWLLNWHYSSHNTAFAQVNLAGPINDTFLGLSFRDIDPILASMFPLLAIMFTLVADKVVGAKPKIKSLEELQKEADELEQKAALRKRINEAKNKQTSSWFRGKIEMVKDAFSEQQSPQKTGENLPENEQTFEPTDEEETVPIPVLQFLAEKEQEKVTNTDPEIVTISSPSHEKNKRKTTMTFEEASEYTGYSISTLKSQLKSGEIKASLSGKLLVSSLKIKGQDGGKLSQFKVGSLPEKSNGHAEKIGV